MILKIDDTVWNQFTNSVSALSRKSGQTEEQKHSAGVAAIGNLIAANVSRANTLAFNAATKAAIEKGLTVSAE